MKSVADPSHYDRSLDGVRGIAVLMVLAHHIVTYIKTPFYFPYARDLIDFGWVGVSLFFIVSAFTLRRSWQYRKATENSPVLKFYVRRAFRILPFWWLNMAISYLNNPVFPALTILANATLTFGFFATDYSWTMVPYGWSLCVEEMFYWLFPAWTKAFNRTSTVFLAGLVALAFAYVWDNGAPRYFGRVENHEFYFGFPISRYFVFFCGLLAFHLMSESWWERAWQWITSQKIPWVDLLILFIYYRRSDPYAATITVFLIFMASRTDRTYIGKLTRTRWLSAIGTLCYSMYLLHWHALFYIDPLKDRIFAALGVPAVGEIQILVMTIVIGLVTFLASLFTYNLIEYPSVLLGRRVLKRFA